MVKSTMSVGLSLATALAAMAGSPVIAQRVKQAAAAVTMAPAPQSLFQVNVGRGRLVTLSRPMTDIFIADDKIADVQVRSPTQLYVFGKATGETNISATNKAGAVVYSTVVRVGNNFDSIQSMLSLAMPEAKVTATPMNGLVLLTGTVAQPEDAAEAERLVQAYVGEGSKVLSRLKTATPLQVNLQVRIAEVSRSFVKNIGVNATTRDATSGLKVGVFQGRSPGEMTAADLSKYPTATIPIAGGGYITGPYDVATGRLIDPDGVSGKITKGATSTTLGLAGKVLGLDLLSAIDIGETIGQVSTLANPNLTALSGETATFLVGGEIPIPLSTGLGAVSVDYKQYGISLAFTPTVLSDGRISVRVRPEVSQLSMASAVTIGGTTIPGISTRRVETTAELGSGQSMMIGGLLQNSHDNSIDKTPGLADLPILGTLFRSNGWRRSETELVIVITPYLVKPVDNASDIVLPTDGRKAPTDFQRVFMGELGAGVTGGKRPVPTMAPSAPGAAGMPVQPEPAPPAPSAPRADFKANPRKSGGIAPGFSN